MTVQAARASFSRLVRKDKMLVTASYSRICALDAKTGAKRWKYEHRLPEGTMPCCDVVNRGAALYGQLVIFRHA